MSAQSLIGICFHINHLLSTTEDSGSNSSISVAFLVLLCPLFTYFQHSFSDPTRCRAPTGITEWRHYGSAIALASALVTG